MLPDLLLFRLFGCLLGLDLFVDPFEGRAEAVEFAHERLVFAPLVHPFQQLFVAYLYFALLQVLINQRSLSILMYMVQPVKLPRPTSMFRASFLRVRMKALTPQKTQIVGLEFLATVVDFVFVQRALLLIP